MSHAALLVLVAVTIWVCFGTIMRYVFQSPVIGVVQFSEYALVYITFLGTAWVLRQGKHVQVDILVRVLSPDWRARIGMLTSVLGFAVSVVLVCFGAAATWTAFVRGSYRPAIIEFPTWIVLIVIPVGAFFLALRFARQFIGHLRDSERTLPPEDGR